MRQVKEAVIRGDRAQLGLMVPRDVLDERDGRRRAEPARDRHFAGEREGLDAAAQARRQALEQLEPTHALGQEELDLEAGPDILSRRQA